MRAYRRIAIITAALAPVNFLLFGVKLYIGLASNSVAIYSDGVNNLLDALSLTVTAAALFLSLGKTTSLLSAVERASIVTEDKLGGSGRSHVKLDFEGGEITMSSVSAGGSGLCFQP